MSRAWMSTGGGPRSGAERHHGPSLWQEWKLLWVHLPKRVRYVDVVGERSGFCTFTRLRLMR